MPHPLMSLSNCMFKQFAANDALINKNAVKEARAVLVLANKNAAMEKKTEAKKLSDAASELKKQNNIAKQNALSEAASELKKQNNIAKQNATMEKKLDAKKLSEAASELKKQNNIAKQNAAMQKKQDAKKLSEAASELKKQHNIAKKNATNAVSVARQALKVANKTNKTNKKNFHLDKNTTDNTAYAVYVAEKALDLATTVHQAYTTSVPVVFATRVNTNVI
jgi:hypothetical protein